MGNEDVVERPAPDELPRRFGFWTGLWLVVASMVGTGILTTSGYTIRATGNHWVLLTLWAIGGLIALSGSLTIAELATRVPRVGGDYVFVREAFGPAWAFVFGLSTVILGFAGPIALVAYTSAEYLLSPFRSELSSSAFLGEGSRGILTPAFASLIVIFFTWSHCRGQRQSAWTQGVTTMLKVAGLGAFAAFGLIFGRGDWGNFSIGKPWSAQDPGALATSLIYVMYGYVGWNAAGYIAGEIRDPRRRLPRCLLGGCVLVTLLYLCVNLMYAYACDPRDLMRMEGDSVQPIARIAAVRLFGPGISRILSILIGVGVLASVSAFILAGTRVPFAMARDGLLPGFVGRVHGERGVPVAATVAQSAVSLALLWSGTFEQLLDYTSIGLSVLAGLMISTIFVLRRRPAPEAFRMPLYPAPPLLYLALTAWVVVHTVQSKPIPSALSLASIAVGFPIYYLVRWRAHRRSRLDANRESS